MAWIETHQSLPTHRKTLAVAELLDVPPVHVVGHLVCLWLWALDNAPDGSLANIGHRTICRAASWEGDSQVFVEALRSAGYLDGETDSLSIHNWHDYAGKLMDRREVNARRMREKRAAHVEDTSIARAPTTGPNRTQPDHDHGDLHDLLSGADAPQEKPEPETTILKERPTPKHAEHFESILRGMGWCLTRCTDNERGQANKAAMQLDKAGYSTTDVDVMFAKWPVVFAGMRVSPSAIANHAQELVNGTAPAGNGAPRGRKPSHPAVDAEWRTEFLNGIKEQQAEVSDETDP